MKLGVRIAGRVRRVELTGAGDCLRGTLDGQPFEADAVEISPGIYSLLIGGRSYEVRVEPHAGKLRIQVAGAEFAAEIADPRQWSRGGGAAAGLEGRQQVVAPMPGKVIRVLVQTGQSVEAGQGLLVVEAMKMQNEVRAPKSGKVERLAVHEGQAVNPGDVLAIIG